MRFIIPRGKSFYSEFTVKEPGASVPRDLTGYTGYFNMSSIGINSCLVLSDVLLELVDPLNGVVSLTLNELQTKDLIGRSGFAEDGYPNVPTYKASLYLVGGDEIYVEIPKVYISDGGTSCEALV